MESKKMESQSDVNKSLDLITTDIVKPSDIWKDRKKVKTVITAERLSTVTKEKNVFQYIGKFIGHLTAVMNIDSKYQKVINLSAVDKSIEYPDNFLDVLKADLLTADDSQRDIYSHLLTAFNNVTVGKSVSRQSADIKQWLT